MSQWKQPKFAYFNGSAIVDFVPTYPATKKSPVGELDAVRNDSITTSGIKQSVTERIDNFLDLPFANVPESDLAGWNTMMAFLLEGVQFDYYPDATDQLTYTPYTLEDKSWKPKWVSWKNYSFTLKLRKFVGTPIYYS